MLSRNLEFDSQNFDTGMIFVRRKMKINCEEWDSDYVLKPCIGGMQKEVSLIVFLSQSESTAMLRLHCSSIFLPWRPFVCPPVVPYVQSYHQGHKVVRASPATY